MSTEIQTTNQIETVHQAAQVLCNMWREGAEHWIRTGQAMEILCKRFPGLPDEICKMDSLITPELIERMRCIGRGELHPNLFLSLCPAARRLRQLPYSMQEQCMREPVPLLIPTERGPEILPVNWVNLQPEQVRQVFSAEGIRSEAQQRAWLEEERFKKAKPVDQPDGYEVKNGHLIFGAWKLGERELERILKQIRAQKRSRRA